LQPFAISAAQVRRTWTFSFFSPVVVIRMMLLPCPINKRPLMGDGYSVVGWQPNLVLCILGMSVPQSSCCGLLPIVKHKVNIIMNQNIMQIMRHREWGQGFVFLLLLKSGRDSMPASNHKSISGGAVCDPAKVFLTFKFRYLLFPTPTHKAKTGTANR
jgi:hypothetical protein